MKMKSIKIITFVLFCSMAAKTAAAGVIPPTYSRLDFIIITSSNFGGDDYNFQADAEELDAGEDSDHDLESEFSLNTESIKIGVIFTPLVESLEWEIQTSVGIANTFMFTLVNCNDSLVSCNESEGEFDCSYTYFSNFPLDLIGFYRLFFNSHSLRVGAGLSYHMNPRLRSGDLPSDWDGKFKNALGGVFEIDYIFANLMLFGLTYEVVDYQIGSKSFKGNNFGLSLGLRF